ncbi:MAG: PAS domain S-box protein [Bacteroidetes bacterium]|nr:PAS domain S-box protein [Bacteroidota bacterium]
MLEESIYQIINKAEYTNLVVDREHKIRFYNEYSFNYIKENANIEIKSGFPIYDFLAPYNVDKFKAAFSRSFRGENVHQEIHFKKDSGEMLFFEAIFTPLTDDDGKVVYTSVRLTELTGLKKLLKALEESEERYRSIVGLRKSLVVRAGLDDCITYVNDACCELFGKKAGEFLGKSFLSFMHPEDSDYIDKKVKACIYDGVTGIIESRIITNYGTKWVSFECAAIRNEKGEIEEVQSIGWDVTDTKNAIHELIHTKYRLGTILDNFDNILLYEIGREDGFISSKISDLLGYEPANLSKINFIPEIIFGEDADDFLLTFNAWKDKKEPGILKQKFRCVKSDGELIWVENLMVKASDTKGVFYCGVIQDITERIISEDTTSRNEALFRIIGESARIGYYVVNYFTDEIVLMNPVFCELWGIDKSLADTKFPDINNSYIRDLCSEQVGNREKFLENSMQYSIPQNVVSFEDVMTLKNGRSLRRFSSVIHDSSGKYLGRFYMVEDVTERILFEKASKSQSDYKALVEEAAAAIFIVNLTGNMVSINNAACALLGCDKEEIIGKNLVEFIHEPELVKNPPKIFEAGEGKTIITKRYIKKKDGSIVFVESRSKLLQNGLIQAVVWEIEDEPQPKTDMNGGNSFATLLTKIKAFRHGETSLMCLNRISLFLKNKSYLETSLVGVTQEESKILFGRFELLLSEYITTVYHQIEFISANVNLILKDMPKISVYNDIRISNEKLLLNARMLKYKLVELQIIITKNGGISGANVDAELIVELARVCITNIKLITKILEENFITDVKQVIDTVLKSYETDNGDVNFVTSIKGNYTHVIFNQVELIEVLNILVKNSLEAFRSAKAGKGNMTVDILVSSDADTLTLAYSDTGPGLPERVKENLFKKGFSTKGVDRGFGLFYAGSVVSKYGGSLNFDSGFNPGAKFVISFNKV